MDPLIIGTIGLILLFLLIGCGTHIGIATGIIGLIGSCFLVGIKPTLALSGWLPYSAVASFTWVTMPMFILMGEFALYSGVSELAFTASYKWLGHIRGGMAMAVTATCALFAACSGSSIASAAVMTRVALPELDKFNYNKAFSAGLIAASGSLAALIPPSMLMIVYSMLTKQSLVKLLLAGFIPGFVSAVIYMIMIHLLFRVKPKLGPRGQYYSWKERFKAIPNIGGVVIIIIFVIGGMYTGVFTATEAAATGAILTLLMALLRRGLTSKRLGEALGMAGVSTSAVFVIIIGTLIFAKFLSLSGLPALAVETISNLDVPRLVVLIAIIFLYIFLGMFLEVVCMMAVSLPVVHPIIISLGYDPIWFGVIVIKMSEVAAISPPLGLNVYSVSGVVGGDVKLEDIFKNIFPFLCMDILTVGLLIAFPQVVLWLPSQLS
jgi:tripartite ATP-independent transporter DctM subunit